MLKKIRDVLEVVSFICVIIGIGFAAFEYTQKVKSDRVEYTIQYIQAFQDESMSAARLELLKPWLEYPMKEISGIPGSDAALSTISMGIVFGEETAIIENLVRVIDYFDVLDACIQNELCDADLAHRHFAGYARDLECLFRDPIEALRETGGLSRLGSGFENIIQKLGRC